MNKLLSFLTFSVLFSSMLIPFGMMDAYAATPGDLYGSTCEDSCINEGVISLVSDTDGLHTVIGDPTTDGSISGLAFDITGRLWGTNNFMGPQSNLIEINPDTGALISSIAITNAAGTQGGIQDLAVQPGTNVLFGSSHGNDVTFDPLGGDEKLVIIDRTTGIGTPLAEDLPCFSCPIGFAPDGTLYLFEDDTLYTIDPTDGSTLTSQAADDWDVHGLGVRSDGVIFLASHETLLSVNPSGGTVTELGDGDDDSITDLTFVPKVVVAGEIIPIESTSLLLAGAQSFSWMIPVLLSGVGIGIFVVSRKS